MSEGLETFKRTDRMPPGETSALADSRRRHLVKARSLLEASGRASGRLPRNLYLKAPKVLRLPRNLDCKVHKVLRLPRNLHFKTQKVLRLPRDLSLQGPQSTAPATKSALQGSPRIATAHEISRSTKYCNCNEKEIA